MIKKRTGRIVVTAVLALSMVITSFAYAFAAEGTTVKASSNVMSWSSAKTIFLNKLPGEGGIKYLRLTTDDGIKVYEGKAVRGKNLYTIEINAKTGKIRDYDRDYIGSKYSASKVGAVSRDTIISKIKKKVPGATIIYVRLTRDDGRYVYEAEAYRKGYEYEFEYSKKGTLLDFEKNRV